MSGLEILAVIGIVGFVIYQQLSGQALRGKRVVLLPAVLTVIGFTDLHGSGKQHLQSVDIVCLVIGAGGSIAVGLGFGAITRLESRNGALWARMPVRGLWLWAALVGWRVVVMLLATAMHAHVAASSATLLFTLGLNRLAQAAVIMPRAMAAGIPFAPEKDGRTFLSSAFDRGRTDQPRSQGTQGGPRPMRTVRRDDFAEQWDSRPWERDERRDSGYQGDGYRGDGRDRDSRDRGRRDRRDDHRRGHPSDRRAERRADRRAAAFDRWGRR